MSVKEDIKVGQALRASAKENLSISPFIRGLERYNYKVASLVKDSHVERVIFDGRVRRGLRLKEGLWTK